MDISYLSQYSVLIAIAVLIDIILKAIALWKTGRNNQKTWFILLLIFNTIGLLPVIYLLFFQKDRN
jgi:hypothetical protein